MCVCVCMLGYEFIIKYMNVNICRHVPPLGKQTLICKLNYPWVSKLTIKKKEEEAKLSIRKKIESQQSRSYDIEKRGSIKAK